jgi:hypothetical protein
MSENNHKFGVLPFVMGGFSFIPLIGIPFGAIAIAWGLLTKRAGGRLLAQVATAGLSFAMTISAGTYYVAFVQRGGIYDQLRLTVAQRQLNFLVQEIELYRVRNGHYPESLDELPSGVPTEAVYSANDPTDLRPGLSRRSFYYERVGSDHYLLRSVGFDGTAFTAEDIVPQVDPAALPQCGLLLNPPARLLGAPTPQL